MLRKTASYFFSPPKLFLVNRNKFSIFYIEKFHKMSLLFMDPLSDFKEKLIEKNKNEYGESYPSLKFVSQSEIEKFSDQRSLLLADLVEFARLGAKGSKLDMSRISPGCDCCIAGQWSCLFINDKCNGQCFFCPTEQNDTGVPTTNIVNFTKSRDYNAYIKFFGFKGISLSGGEPLLTFERTLEYIQAIKRSFGDAIYLWLYTNGILLDTEKATRLRDIGLREIRFNIGATGYSLDKVRVAIGVIPIVTVEIPAIPERFTLMQYKLHEMKSAGVDYLNLHQLRLTPFNYSQITKRNYTFLHGEKVTVLESEITALRLLQYALEQKLDLPINYCSFVYKNRFQTAAARRRAADQILDPWESITENGYIRCLAFLGTTESLAKLSQIFINSGCDSQLWRWQESRQRLCFHADLLTFVAMVEASLQVSYSEASLQPTLSYRHRFREIQLSPGKTLFVERAQVTPDFTLDPEDRKRLGRLIRGEPVQSVPDTKLWLEIQRFEQIAEGLAQYF